MLTKIRSALHSAQGVPKLYAAATRAGASPVEAAQIITLSAQALGLAAKRGAGVPGRQNAVRHFIWQAAIAGRFNEKIAQALAEAQEQGTPDSRDSSVDEHNNGVAQAYAREHRDQISAGSTSDSLNRLVEVALQKWEANELIWIKPR